MALPVLKIGLESEVDERMARLESDVHYIRSNISEIKVDIRDLRQETSSNFKWILGAYGGGVLLMLGFVYFLVSRM